MYFNKFIDIFVAIVLFLIIGKLLYIEIKNIRDYRYMTVSVQVTIFINKY